MKNEELRNYRQQYRFKRSTLNACTEPSRSVQLLTHI